MAIAGKASLSRTQTWTRNRFPAVLLMCSSSADKEETELIFGAKKFRLCPPLVETPVPLETYDAHPRRKIVNRWLFLDSWRISFDCKTMMC